MVRLLALLLVFACALPVRAEEPVAKPSPQAGTSAPVAPPLTTPPPAKTPPLTVADQNGLRSCLYGGCLCGMGQCANGEPLKGTLVAAATGALALVGAGITLALVNPPPDANREPRAGQLATLTAVNLGLVAVWVWSLADAYGKGRENALDAGAAVPVVTPDAR